MRCIEVPAVCLFGLGLFSWGCGQSASSVTTGMVADVGHRHGPGHDHKHPHPHTHGHRHGEPLHGGRIVSIGHSHYASGETHYHAEVMQVADGRITFHVLTENAEGKSVDYRVAATEIVAYVDRLDKESTRAQEVVFSAEGEVGESTFAAAVPASLLESKELSVVVPKIELGGEWLNFSFKTSTKDEPAPSAKTTDETST